MYVLGIMIGHVTPEAFDGGPIALVEEGDLIEIDMSTKTISLVTCRSIMMVVEYLVLQRVEDSILSARRQKWKADTDEVTGLLLKYRNCVKSAHYGATTY